MITWQQDLPRTQETLINFRINKHHWACGSASESGWQLPMFSVFNIEHCLLLGASTNKSVLARDGCRMGCLTHLHYEMLLPVVPKELTLSFTGFRKAPRVIVKECRKHYGLKKPLRAVFCMALLSALWWITDKVPCQVHHAELHP